MRKKDRWMLCKEEQELNIDWCGSSARVRLGDRAGLRMQGQRGKAAILGCPGGVAHLQLVPALLSFG